MPQINPSYLRVPALVIPFRQCTYFDQSDNTWIGIRKNKMYVAPTVIETRENKEAECAHKRDVLGTCKACAFADEGETVIEFCSEWQFDDGFLIVYPKHGELDYKPAKTIDQTIQDNATYTRNGGYFVRVSPTNNDFGHVKIPQLANKRINWRPSGELIRKIQSLCGGYVGIEPEWIIRYGYVSSRPIVSKLYYPFASGDPKFEKAVRDYLAEMRRIRHLQNITTNEVRKKVKVSVKDKCFPKHWILSRKSKKIN